MTELTGWRLARASRDWFSGTELEGNASAYVRYLSERGYAPLTVKVYLESVAHFAHWCARQRIGLPEINEGVAERFLNRHLPLCRCARRCQRAQNTVGAALAHLLDLLRTGGRIAPEKSPDPAAIAEEVLRFEHYLTQVCGLRPATCATRVKLVRAFLLDRFSAGRVWIRALKAAEIIRFLRKYT